jgi:membrane dipeptidase
MIGGKRMEVIDTHCDALFKLQQAERRTGFNDSLDFRTNSAIDTNLGNLKKGHVKVQFFAIFIEPAVPTDEMWQHALEQIDLFYTEILEKNQEMRHIKNFREIDRLKPGEIGAVLTLEGADCIGNDITKLKTLYRLGVLAIGLTWNHGNLCADGAEEARGAGLTALGEKVVALNNTAGVWTDVSHLSDKALFEVLERAHFPFASHSNARSVCNHPRNLPDEAIELLIEKESCIHLVFFPPFIKEKSETATIADLIKHTDHICSLGGEAHIGFGSDFDGITKYVDQLTNSWDYVHLINELLKYYPEETVKGFAYDNFRRMVAAASKR